MELNHQTHVYSKYRVTTGKRGQTEVRCGFCNEWTLIRTLQPIVVGIWTRIPYKKEWVERGPGYTVFEKRKCFLMWVVKHRKTHGCIRCGYIMMRTRGCTPPFKSPSKGLRFLNLGRRDQILEEERKREAQQPVGGQ